MTFSLLVQYAAVVLALAIFFTILAVVFDAIVKVVSDFRCAYAIVKVAEEVAEEQADFDRHVQSTIGMRPFMHTLN